MAFFWPFRRKQTQEKAAQALDDRGWTRLFDWTPGAWQTHHPYDAETSVLAYPTVFACSTLIQSDIGKLRPLVQRKSSGVWDDTDHASARLLRNPNNYQNHIQFKEAWINSKLNHGNTYVLKVLKGGMVDELHILDPLKVTPLVADNNDVFYRINKDQLAPFEETDDEQVVIPANRVIHDRFNCLYHPLVGLSPIFAAGTAATTGLTVQKNNKNFFKNGTNPGGVLTAPGSISDGTATRLKAYFDANFGGDKSGTVAVVGDGLKYEPMRMTSIDAQMIETLGWGDEKVCSVYHVPAHMVGVGQQPTHNNIEALIQQYYSQCLQVLIESMETALDDGLDIPAGHRTQLDLDGLFRMDQSTQMNILKIGREAGLVSPDEGRKKLNLAPVPGGKYPYLQQQNYSLEALAQRDAENPLGKPPEPVSEPVPEPTDDEMADQDKVLTMFMTRELMH